MNRTDLKRTIVRVIIAVGILLSMLVAGGAPTEEPHGVTITQELM